MQIVSFQTLQKLKPVCQIHDPIVGVSFKKGFEGIPKRFDGITAFDLSIDHIQDRSAKCDKGQVLILSPVLSGCEAIDITSSGVPANDCVAGKMIC